LADVAGKKLEFSQSPGSGKVSQTLLLKGTEAIVHQNSKSSSASANKSKHDN
jgi:hypothetical protein